MDTKTPRLPAHDNYGRPINGAAVPISPQEHFAATIQVALQAGLRLLAPGYKAIALFVRDDKPQHDLALGTGTLGDALKSIKTHMKAEEFEAIAGKADPRQSARLKDLSMRLEIAHVAIRRAVPFLDGHSGRIAKGYLTPVLMGEAAASPRDDLIVRLSNILAAHTQDEVLLSTLAAADQLTAAEMLEQIEMWQSYEEPVEQAKLDLACAKPPLSVRPHEHFTTERWQSGEKPARICEAGHAFDESHNDDAACAVCGLRMMPYVVAPGIGI